MGYVEYTPGDLIDCNDTDAAVNPSVPVSAEPVQRRPRQPCDNQYDGLLPPIEEIDEDGDGYVACILDVPLEIGLGLR